MATSLIVQQDFNLPDIERMAIAIARGGLFGITDQNKVLTLCLLAHAEGRHPALAIRDYDIIEGAPAKKAEAMLRDFLGAGGKVEWHALDDDQADATFSHPQGGTVRIDWNMKRAGQAGLLGRKGDMYKKYPRPMLRSRCISEGVKSVFPAASGGLYTPEEMRDIKAEEPIKQARTVRPAPGRSLKPPEPAPDAAQTVDAVIDDFPSDEGLEQARELLDEAAKEGMDALEKCWRQPGMRPFRESLRESLAGFQDIARAHDREQTLFPKDEPQDE